MVRVILEGEPYDVAEGSTILAALTRAGQVVPHLCHDPRLAPAGACRLCVVEVEGHEGTVPSCCTEVREGMRVRTHTAALEEKRRAVLTLLARHHPKDALDAAYDGELAHAFRAYGVVPTGPADPERVDDAHPYIRVDMARCIDCFRCERICNEVQGQGVWQVWGRGGDVRLVPDSGTTLRESSCVACGACVDACPSGALSDKSVIVHGRPTKWTRTTCAYCGVGCELQVGTREGRIVDARPVLDAPVNRGHLCVKGRYAFDFVDADDRVTQPLLREGDAFRPVSWQHAIAFIARRLREITDAHGPDSVGVLGSARGTNEDAYVAQKFARVVLGTNNVDCCARVCHAPSAAALKTMLGTGAATSSFADIEHARTIFVAGSNATSCHPVVGARIKQAALRGTNLVVVDSRRTELAEVANLHLQPRPGTDLALFHAMSRVAFDEGLVDEAFLRERVDGVAEFRAFLEGYDPERVAVLCDVPVEDLRRAARLLAVERPSMSVHGLGLTEHVHGTDTVVALIDLFLVTGNVGRRGAGVNPLRGQNNVQGAAHMGCEPRGLPGLVPVEKDRARFESAWGVALPQNRGLDLLEMLDAARAGTFKALWAVGYDVYLTNPEAARTHEALSELELLVVQDPFLTETARTFAHVVLPAASSFEKDGTFMNAERRVQRVRAVVPPRHTSRVDWEIFCEVARQMGRSTGFEFDSAAAIWDEIRSVWPVGAGITYERLEHGGLQWPCPDEAHPGTEFLHATEFAHGPRTTLRCVEPVPSPEVPSDDYPWLLVTGRHLQQFNAGTMTGRTPQNDLRPTDVLEMTPEDAATLGLHEGELVRVVSRHGEATLPVGIRSALRRGELFATFHDAGTFLNRITGTALDPRTHTPAYKRTAVRIERPGQPV